ncbi:MAG: hypothetical protein LW884_05975 [Bacteroidetes bacterium]|jgi:hypothetical protein|nr:hypothetical protein [Bacteroidota bacterium]
MKFWYSFLFLLAFTACTRDEFKPQGPPPAPTFQDLGPLVTLASPLANPGAEYTILNRDSTIDSLDVTDSVYFRVIGLPISSLRLSHLEVARSTDGGATSQPLVRFPATGSLVFADTTQTQLDTPLTFEMPELPGSYTYIFRLFNTAGQIGTDTLSLSITGA